MQVSTRSLLISPRLRMRSMLCTTGGALSDEDLKKSLRVDGGQLDPILC